MNIDFSQTLPSINGSFDFPGYKMDFSNNSTYFSGSYISNSQYYSTQPLLWNGLSNFGSHNCQQSPVQSFGLGFEQSETLISNSDIKISKKEIKLLDSLVIECKRDWKKISARFKKITNKVISPEDLRVSYKNSVPRKKKGGKFSTLEDAELKKLVEIEGQNWLKIAKSFPKRTPLSLRNRYYANKRAGGQFSGNSTQSTSSLVSPVEEASLDCSLIVVEQDILKQHISEIELNEKPLWLEVIESMIF